jgi:hypothetical protein
MVVCKTDYFQQVVRKRCNGGAALPFTKYTAKRAGSEGKSEKGRSRGDCAEKRSDGAGFELAKVFVDGITGDAKTAGDDLHRVF